MQVHDGPYAETQEQLGGYYHHRGQGHGRGPELGGTMPRPPCGATSKSARSATRRLKFRASKCRSSRPACRHCRAGAWCPAPNQETTMQYMLLIIGDEAVDELRDAVDDTGMSAEYAAYNEALTKAGVIARRRAPEAHHGDAPRPGPRQARPWCSMAPTPRPRNSSAATTSSMCRRSRRGHRMGQALPRRQVRHHRSPADLADGPHDAPESSRTRSKSAGLARHCSIGACGPGTNGDTPCAT